MGIFRTSLERSLGFCFGLLFAMIPVAAAAQVEQPAMLVIEGGTLIDGNGGAPVRDVLILIQGNKITAVARKGQVSYPATAKVLRAEGKFILPGLIETHCHYEWYLGELFLAYGQTACIELGGGEETGLLLRAAINAGKIRAPRLFVAGGSLAGRENPARPRGELRGPRNTWVAHTPEEARQIVREFLPYKPDMIEMGDGDLTPEQYQAAIDEVHQAGLPAVARSIGPKTNAREAVLAGADILEHAAGVCVSTSQDPSKWKDYSGVDTLPCADMDDAKAAELIQLMLQRKVHLEPDLIIKGPGLPSGWPRFEIEDYLALSTPALLAYLPADRVKMNLGKYHETPDRMELRKKGYQNLAHFVHQYAAGGGRVWAGSDEPNNSLGGLGLHHEMETLVDDAGLTPMQVIQGVTRWPAEGLRKQDRLGTVEAGKEADLLIVNADPLQNIKNLQKIEWLIQFGKVVDRSYHPWYSVPWTGSPNQGSPPIEAMNWVLAMKSMGGGGQATAAIEFLSPLVVTEGSPTVTLTVKGFNFSVENLVVYASDHRVPFRRISGTELEVTIDESLLRAAGTLDIVIKNIGRAPNREWWNNGTSNTAHLLVDYRY